MSKSVKQAGLSSISLTDECDNRELFHELYYNKKRRFWLAQRLSLSIIAQIVLKVNKGGKTGVILV